MSILDRPFFHDETAAYQFLEGILWPFGPFCPHCGCVDRIHRIKANPEKRVRHGLCRCDHCRKQFTVKVGTVFESAHIPLHKCLQGVYLIASSKKGISSNQLARTLEIQVNSAWFLSHRIREAMKDNGMKLGDFGNVVEIDETFIGRDKEKPLRRGYAHKHKVLSLVDRATGRARSIVVDDLKTATIMPILRKNVSRDSRIMTDEAGQYKHLSRVFRGGHGVVKHGDEEYVSRDDETVHTNTIEGFFSVFKRGMRGIYQHCGEKHLPRYLAEFDFRYSNRKALGIEDPERAVKILTGIIGKRLTYRPADSAEA